MRRIETTTAFKRDFKRTKATPKHRNLDGLLVPLLNLLVADVPLPPKYLQERVRFSQRGDRPLRLRELALESDDLLTQAAHLCRIGIGTASTRRVRDARRDVLAPMVQ